MDRKYTYVTAQAIQHSLDMGGWSQTDHAVDIRCEYDEMGIDLDPLFKIRHVNPIWDLNVRHIVRNTIWSIPRYRRPSVKKVMEGVYEKMKELTGE